MVFVVAERVPPRCDTVILVGKKMKRGGEWGRGGVGEKETREGERSFQGVKEKNVNKGLARWYL